MPVIANFLLALANTAREFGSNDWKIQENGSKLEISVRSRENDSDTLHDNLYDNAGLYPEGVANPVKLPQKHEKGEIEGSFFASEEYKSWQETEIVTEALTGPEMKDDSFLKSEHLPQIIAVIGLVLVVLLLL